jgi:agmatine deiminase
MLSFSSLLTTKESYVPFWQRLNKILEDNKIDYQLLGNTKDVWCRDYMPIKRGDGSCVQFKYDPEYLVGLEHIHTDINEVHPYPEKIIHCDLIADGGSIIVGKNLLFYSSMIEEDNKLTDAEVSKILCEKFNVAKAIRVKNYPYDFTGHLDALIRFIDDENIIYSDVNPSDSYRRNFLKTVRKSGLKLKPFPYFELDRKNKYGYYTAVGCYLNFTHLEEHILLPQFDHPMDRDALSKAREYFPDHKVIPVMSNQVAEYSGVLNCISWG